MPTTNLSPAKKTGHASHTKTADRQEGLPGEILRPIHLTFLGAGSGFCPRLCKDVLSIPGLQGGEIRLVDLDTERLGMMHKVIEAQVRATPNAGAWTVRSSTDRREALPGTHYAVCCVEVSGLDCVKHDNDIPLKYGIDQCIGDTTGPGGLFKGLRTVPVFLDILRDMRELCPDAVMLNYTNPMSMMCLAAGRAVPEVAVVGLCHSVQGTSELLAKYAGIERSELRFECAGVNHLAWFTRLEHRGEDLYAKTLNERFTQEVAAAHAEAQAGKAVYDSADIDWSKSDEERKAELPYEQEDVVRKDMCRQFGAFITESSGHLSEYLPYYRKNEAGRALLRRHYDGGSRFYATNWPAWRAAADERRAELVAGTVTEDAERSWEYASWIIEAIEKDSPVRIHGNVMNRDARVVRGSAGRGSLGEAGKLITNLPGDGCVEVACLVDGAGIQPTRYGALPPAMAQVCRHAMGTYDLGATAVIEQSKDAAVEALLLDPLTQAVLSPSEIRAMTLEMFEAEAAWLPAYR